MRLDVLIYAVCLTTCISAKTAYSAEQYENISLEEAIQIALTNHPNQKISANAIQIAESHYREALSLRWPSLDLQSTYSHRNNPMTQTVSPLNVSIAGLATPLNGALAAALGGAAPTLPQSITVPENNVKLFGTTLAVTTLHAQYPIYTGGKISSIIEQATLGKQAADEQATKTRMQVIYDVKRYYYSTQLTNELVSLSKSTYDELNDIASMAESFYKAGENNVNKMDYNKIINAKKYRSDNSIGNGKEKSGRLCRFKICHGFGSKCKSDYFNPVANGYPNATIVRVTGF
jgi:outer membrane protein